MYEQKEPNVLDYYNQLESVFSYLEKFDGLTNLHKAKSINIQSAPTFGRVALPFKIGKIVFSYSLSRAEYSLKTYSAHFWRLV